MTDFERIAFVLTIPLPAAALVWAAASDYFTYTIPNRSCVVIAAAYAAVAAQMPAGPWLAGLATGAAVLAVGTALFARNLVGGGDVKLAAAATLWAGPALLSQFALAVALTGAALALVMLSPVRRLMPASPKGSAAGLAQPMPFGVPLAAGGLVVLALQLAARI